jgi:general secretion pathway protein G
MKRHRGVTYIELMVVLALMGILAASALPFLHHKYRSMQEDELRRKLTMMRTAIDRYHDMAKQGMIEPWDLDWMMYPEDLEMLVEGVEVKMSMEQPATTVRFLREIPVDPITGEREWSCRGYEDDPDDFQSRCDTLYDVASTAQRRALDGSYYNEW